MTYRVVWSNDGASGELPGEYDTEAEAEAAGAAWKAEMVAIDDDKEAAEYFYDYDTVEIERDELGDRIDWEMDKDR